MTTTAYPATTDQVVRAFLERTALKQEINGQIGDTDSWIQTEVPHLTLDLDYEMGYLILVHDRSTDTWPWFVIVTRFGPKIDGGQYVRWEHDSYQLNTIGLDTYAACVEAVPKMFGLLEGLQDTDKKRTT